MRNEQRRQTQVGAWVWIAITLAGLLALGSGWILGSSDWGATSPDDVAARIRAGLVLTFSLLIFASLLAPALRGERGARNGVQPISTPWWTDPIADATPDAVFTFDEQMLVRSANKGAEELFGYTAREIAGQSMFQLIPSSTDFTNARALTETHNRKGLALNLTGITRDGTELPVNLHLTRFERGSGTMYLAICRRRRPASKPPGTKPKPPVEADWSGPFITHIGKEIDNAVTKILGYSDVILSSLSEDSPHRRDLTEIRATGEHLGGLSQILQIVGRTPTRRGSQFDVHQWLRGLPQSAEGGTRPSVDLILDAAQPMARAEVAYLGVVMTRLLNAPKDSEARISIRTQNQRPEEGGRLLIEITRPDPLPELDQLTFELARGIVGKTGCSLEGHPIEDGATGLTLSLPPA